MRELQSDLPRHQPVPLDAEAEECLRWRVPRILNRSPEGGA
jgi:hypothetical protein